MKASSLQSLLKKATCLRFSREFVHRTVAYGSQIHSLQRVAIHPFSTSFHRTFFVLGLSGAFFILAFALPVHAQTVNCATTYRGNCTLRATCEQSVAQGTMKIQTSTNCEATAGNVCCVSVSATASAGKSGTVATVGFGLKNPLGNRTIPQLIGDIVSWLGALAGMLFFGMMLWGGIEWMTARGDGKQVQQAQKRIINSILGIGIILLSYVIIDTVIGLPNVLVGG
jgi:hypothetical protein